MWVVGNQLANYFFFHTPHANNYTLWVIPNLCTYNTIGSIDQYEIILFCNLLKAPKPSQNNIVIYQNLI